MKRAEFNKRLKQLEEKGIINLDAKVCDPNTKRVYEKGYYIICEPCKMHRNNNYGIINLRQRFYKYYYD